MTHVISPPLDQRIVVDFFQLAQSRKTYKLAWFYGMLATFGVKAEHLWGFTWNPDGTINIQNKKKPIRPMFELLLAYKMRKAFYKPSKASKVLEPALACS